MELTFILLIIFYVIFYLLRPFSKKELEKLVNENGYKEELQDLYLREILDEDKKFDEDFIID